MEVGRGNRELFFLHTSFSNAGIKNYHFCTFSLRGPPHPFSLSLLHTLSMCPFVRVSPFLFLPYLRVNTGTSPLVDEGLILWFFFSFSSFYTYIGS